MLMFKVLLVDDEMYVRRGLRNLIDWHESGFEIVDEADNGADALRLIEEIRPDLVITDIRMPVLSGLELIGQVNETGRFNIPFIILSGYGDFKYAQQAVRYNVHDYILKPVDEDELRAALQKIGDRLRQSQASGMDQENSLLASFFRSLLMDAGEEREAIERDKIERRLLADDAAELYYFIVESEPIGGDKAVIADTITSVAGIDVPTYVHEQERNRFGFVGTTRHFERFGGVMERFAEAVRNEAVKRFSRELRLYAGQCARCIDELADSCRTANQLLQYKFAVPESDVISYEAVKDIPLIHTDADRQFISALTERMEENDSAAIRHAVDALLLEFQAKRLAPHAVGRTIDRCVGSIMETIVGMKGNTEVLIALKTFEPLSQWNSHSGGVGSLRRLLTDLALEGAVLIADLRKEKMHGSIHQIKKHIEAHFRENMSLKSIAGKFYMNPVYVGQLFRKAYGLYFNEFLLKVRIQEAKQLLRQTELRIYEIAERVGFNSADYFVTQFEKLERMSPSDYRNLLLNKTFQNGGANANLKLK
ncbi:response regulator transcription factor [Cohnella silvisoli]|uniref:Response regulator transcription factor n=1 Tax=Cohnella silvisoli TaxID=2873699 RepID=A0ABV1KWA8_9BACL|nr:response regulator transcription factor [Cohnella silvisoli]MCD9023726.1 response regulator transcription factor [Cohnella silvisoli]